MSKYTMEFDDAFDKTLSELRESTDATTKADVIRRAVSSYKILKKDAMREGKIFVADKDGKILKEVILP